MEVRYSRNSKIINRKFYQYLIPMVLMTLAMQFGSLADAILVGHMVGEDALSAASLALPVVFLAELPGFAIAAGASIVAANFIGKRQIQEASATFRGAIFWGIAASLVFLPMGFLLADPLATWLAGNFVSLKEMMRQYIMIYFLQAPILGLGLVVSYFLPSDNSPVLGAVFFLIANTVHLVAEALFCAFLDRSVVMYGVAASMGIGMLTGLVVLIPYARSKRRSISFSTPWGKSLRMVLPLLRAGAATAASTGLSCVFYLVLNLAATSFLSEPEMPIFAMLSNMTFVIDLFLVGVLQVMPSVIPTLLGEKDYFGVRSILRHVLLISAGITAVLLTVSLIFPQLFFYLFGVGIDTSGPVDPLFVMRIFSLSFLFYAGNRFLVNYYPSIMVVSPGVVSNLTRLGAVGPVVIYFLMRQMGVIGYAYGNIAMEGATLLATIVFVLILHKVKRIEGSALFLIPKGKAISGTEFTIPASMEEISSAVAEIEKSALGLSEDPKSAALLALACEEVCVNVIEYGLKRQFAVKFIDVSISREEESLIVHIRDDGVAFDPTVYQPEETEMRYHGIEVVRSVAKSFQYLRALNTNNTIVEIELAKQGGA